MGISYVFADPSYTSYYIPKYHDTRYVVDTRTPYHEYLTNLPTFPIR